MLTALRLTLLVVALATSMLSSFRAEAAGRVDPPGHQDGNQCINAFGVNLNELYGVSEQVRMFDCMAISAGEHWIRPLWWITNFEAASIYPDGYVPARSAPLDDFVSKLSAVVFVVDGGTVMERRYTFDAKDIQRTDIDAEQLEPGSWGAPYPMDSILARLRPLSVGAHFVEAYLVLTAEHCDGFTTTADFSCLPAGVTQFVGHPVVFSVPAH